MLIFRDQCHWSWTVCINLRAQNRLAIWGNFLRGHEVTESKSRDKIRYRLHVFQCLGPRSRRLSDIYESCIDLCFCILCTCLIPYALQSSRRSPPITDYAPLHWCYTCFHVKMCPSDRAWGVTTRIDIRAMPASCNFDCRLLTRCNPVFLFEHWLRESLAGLGLVFMPLPPDCRMTGKRSKQTETKILTKNINIEQFFFKTNEHRG